MIFCVQLLALNVSEKTKISLLGLRNFSTTIFWRSTFNRKFFTALLISQIGNQAISRTKLTHNYKKMISRLID